MILRNGYSIPTKLIRVTDRALFGDNYRVSEVFGVDGRNEDDYGHVFEWEDLTEAIWSEGSYCIRGCLGFEPDCVLLIHDGEPIGFYMGGQAWIDPEHRGQGLGSKMIVACIAMSGELPPVRDIGFSPAGFRAHERALEMLVEMAPSARPTA